MTPRDTISPPGTPEGGRGEEENTAAHEVINIRHPAIENHIRADLEGRLADIPSVEERRRELAARAEAQQPQEPTEPNQD